MNNAIQYKFLTSENIHFVIKLHSENSVENLRILYKFQLRSVTSNYTPLGGNLVWFQDWHAVL